MGEEPKSFDVFETLNALKEGQKTISEELKTLKEDVKKINNKIEELSSPPAYGEPPKYGAPAPQYPPGLYPVPKLKALIEKLAKELKVPIEGTLKDFIDALTPEKEETVAGLLPMRPIVPNVDTQARELAEKLRRR